MTLLSTSIPHLPLTNNMTFDGLPVELVVSVLEELDLTSLVTMSALSRRLREIISDPFLNPWRQPIARILANGSCADEPLLRHIAERSTVPRQNALDILILAPPAFILFDFTIPNLRQVDWEMIFRKRFLPGWVKWKRDLSWRETYKRCVRRHSAITHRSCGNQTAFSCVCGTAARRPAQQKKPGPSKHRSRPSYRV